MLEKLEKGDTIYWKTNKDCGESRLKNIWLAADKTYLLQFALEGDILDVFDYFYPDGTLQTPRKDELQISLTPFQTSDMLENLKLNDKKIRYLTDREMDGAIFAWGLIPLSGVLLFLAQDYNMATICLVVAGIALLIFPLLLVTLVLFKEGTSMKIIRFFQICIMLFAAGVFLFHFTTPVINTFSNFSERKDFVVTHDFFNTNKGVLAVQRKSAAYESEQSICLMNDDKWTAIKGEVPSDIHKQYLFAKSVLSVEDKKFCQAHQIDFPFIVGSPEDFSRLEDEVKKSLKQYKPLY